MATSYEIEEMMVNKVTLALRNEFTTDEIAVVYKDQTTQNFEKPCLVVLEYDQQEEHLLNNTSRYYVYFDVMYHIEMTSSTGVYTSFRTIAKRMSRVLNYITLESTYTHNRETRFRKGGWDETVKDNVGHCMFYYSYIASLQDTTSTVAITSVTGDNYVKT